MFSKQKETFLFLILVARKKSCLEMQLFDLGSEGNYFGEAAAIGQGMKCGQGAHVSFNSWPACEVGGKILILQMKTPEREGESVRAGLKLWRGALKPRAGSPLGRPAYLIFTGRRSSSLSAFEPEKTSFPVPLSSSLFSRFLNNFLYLKGRNAKHRQRENRATLPGGCRGMKNNSKEFFPPPALHHPPPVLQSVLPHADSLPPSGRQL